MLSCGLEAMLFVWLVIWLSAAFVADPPQSLPRSPLCPLPEVLQLDSRVNTLDEPPANAVTRRLREAPSELVSVLCIFSKR